MGLQTLHREYYRQHKIQITEEESKRKIELKRSKTRIGFLPVHTQSTLETTEPCEEDQGCEYLPVPTDDKSIFRILTKNPRGINVETAPKDVKLVTELHTVHTMQIGALALQESNIDWKQDRS